MPHILSVSLGSSQRDKRAEATLLGQEFILERRGADGDLARFGALFREYDGRVDALCVGGTNLGLHWRRRYYPFRDIQRLVRQVKHTPVVDGSGVKNTLEREAIRRLQDRGVVDFTTANVFLVCSTDRFGMAEAISHYTRRMVIGDLMFNLGLPIPLHSLRSIDVIAPLALPILGWLPFKWLYPTGEQQEEVKPKYQRFYQWADVIAGDYLLIRQHMPDRLEGKTILTNTTTEQDVADLRARGVARLITTTPVVEGRSFGTNVLEGVFVTVLGRPPSEIRPEEYLELAQRIGWEPIVRELGEAAGASPA